MKRACGILLPVSSLSGNYGIGGFSKEAYEFVDKLKRAGQSYWQILPLSPTGYGDSPYQSGSAFAGNMNYIALDELTEAGFFEKEELEEIDWGKDSAWVDYEKVWNSREKLLKKAFLKRRDCEYEVETQNLLEETKRYCLYQAIKAENKGLPWYEWEEGLKLAKKEAINKAKKRLADEIEFYEWIQAVFEKQWKALKKYANEVGIEIIGDMPIYVSIDSADAWSHPELFLFNEYKAPELVAGCPPDYFSPEGQLWGNPLYDWKKHKKTDFAWWKNRLEYVLKLYNYVRVDHFRGFDEFYAIPAQNTNALEGEWLKGPGIEIFNSLSRHFAKQYKAGLPIIAEDLGLMTDSVIKLVKDTGFPAMRVLEFAYDSDADNMYLPHNYIRNCVAYTGTHDNSPIQAWAESLDENRRLFMVRYQGSEHTPVKDLHWDCVRTVLASIADTVIIPMQDYLGLGESSRINSPGVATGNWQWRLSGDEIDENLIWHCDMLAGIYSRKP